MIGINLRNKHFLVDFFSTSFNLSLRILYINKLENPVMGNYFLILPPRGLLPCRTMKWSRDGNGCGPSGGQEMIL
jgi:hypothetical protein